jgi:hypothetical protein
VAQPDPSVSLSHALRSFHKWRINFTHLESMAAASMCRNIDHLNFYLFVSIKPIGFKDNRISYLCSSRIFGVTLKVGHARSTSE